MKMVSGNIDVDRGAEIGFGQGEWLLALVQREFAIIEPDFHILVDEM
jgi:tRNA G46 methylase TrmB